MENQQQFRNFIVTVVDFTKSNYIAFLGLYVWLGYQYLNGYLEFYGYNALDVCGPIDIIFWGALRFTPMFIIPFGMALVYSPISNSIIDLSSKFISLIFRPIGYAGSILVRAKRRNIANSTASELSMFASEARKHFSSWRKANLLFFLFFVILFSIPLLIGQLTTYSPNQSSVYEYIKKDVFRSSLDGALFAFEKSRHIELSYGRLKDYKDQRAIIVSDEFSYYQYISYLGLYYYLVLGLGCASYLIIYMKKVDRFGNNIISISISWMAILSFGFFSHTSAKIDAANELIKYETRTEKYKNTSGYYNINDFCVGRGRVIFNGEKTVFMICENRLVYQIKDSPITSSREMFVNVLR